MGGLKRKIRMEKIKNKEARAVAFSKRRNGLYSKICELCLLSDDTKMAFITTPVSSNSNVSFYTFGHDSVDSVVDAFLANERPRNEKLRYWWEDESLAKSENPEEMRDAIDSMMKMLQDLKELVKRRECEDVKKKKEKKNKGKQTLNPQACSTSVCVQDAITVNFEGFHKNTEDQTLAVSGNSNNNGLVGTFDGCSQELDQVFDFVTNSEVPSMNCLEMGDISMVNTNQNMFSDSEAGEDKSLVIHKDLDEDIFHLPELDDNNIGLPGNVSWFNQELDFDKIIDFETKLKMDSVSMAPTSNQNMCFGFETVKDED